MKTFALAGVGFVAEKHLQAIRAINGELTVVCNLHDSVGTLDKYFPKTKFFLDPIEFEEYLLSNPVDYLIICTPNWTHLDYLQMADRLKIESICEKPIVTYPNELDKFSDTNAIVQLRYVDNLSDIHPINGKIDIKYFTPRGNWYSKSWKGDNILSGGLLMNIGIHLFDLMIYLFGDYKNVRLNINSDDSKSGSFDAGETSVHWQLSTSPEYSQPIRTVNNLSLFMKKDLHIKAYKEILRGNGIKKKDIKQSLELVNEYQKLSKNL